MHIIFFFFPTTTTTNVNSKEQSNKGNKNKEFNRIIVTKKVRFNLKQI